MRIILISFLLIFYFIRPINLQNTYLSMYTAEERITMAYGFNSNEGENTNFKLVTLRTDTTDIRFLPPNEKDMFRSHKLKAPGVKVLAGILPSGRWAFCHGGTQCIINTFNF